MSKRNEAILNRALNTLTSEATKQNIIAHNIIIVPVGSKYLFVKGLEIPLVNPVIHVETSVSNNSDVYTYQRTNITLSIGNPLKFDTLIHDRNSNLYYMILSQKPYNDNNVFHYNLEQLDAGNLIILNSIDDMELEQYKDQVFDFNSLPYLLDLFSKENIDIYPKNLQLFNKELLEKKGLFIEVLDSYTPAQYPNFKNLKAFVNRYDYVRIYYNNYTQKDIMHIFEVYDKLIKKNKLSITEGNIFNIIKWRDEGISAPIATYSDFGLNYNLSNSNIVDPINYIKKVYLDISKLHNGV